MYLRTRTQRRVDGGQTTVALAGVMAATCLLGLGLALIAQAMVHRARARNAADAVALATVVEPGAATDLSEWYGRRGVRVESHDGQTLARSGPSRAIAWAGLSEGATQPAPVMVAIIARAEQLVGATFSEPRVEHLRVELLPVDAALMHLVAAELGLCAVFDPTPPSGREVFALC